MNQNQYKTIESAVMRRLEQGLPKNLLFHNASHVKRILGAVEIIAPNEGVAGENIYILKLGGLFKYVGYTKTIFNYKEESKRIAKDTLSHLGYLTNSQLKKVLDLISIDPCTNLPLDSIMYDAYTFHLGGLDFFMKNESLRMEKELLEQKVIWLKSWYEQTLELLKSHDYITPTAKKLRDKTKKRNILQLQNLLGKEKI